MKKLWMTAIAALLTAPAIAAEKPSSDEVQRVMEYYQSGDEVVLAQQVLCGEVAKEGDNKNQCVAVIEPAVMKEGDRNLVWMNFMVPGSESAKILVQFHYKGRVLSSKELTLSNAIRYRTWLSAPSSKTGEWTVSVEQELADGYAKVGEMSYTVEAAE